MAQRSLRDFFGEPSTKRARASSSTPAGDVSDSELEPNSELEPEPDTQTSQLQSTEITVCSAECCQTNSTADKPLQTTDPIILRSTRKLVGQKWRQFSPEWYKAYPWLVLCTTRLKALCFYCRYSHHNQLLTEKRVGGGDAFYLMGFDNWKKAHECFTQHEKSAIHREAVLKHQLMKQPSVIVQMHDQAKRDQKLHRDLLLKQLSSLKYLLRQGLAIRGHEEHEGNLVQLLLLRCEDCPGLKTWIEARKYLSNEILNEMMSLMSNSVLRAILCEIREARVFALLADETSDVSQKEQLCINVRWVDSSSNIHEAPLELIHVPKTDASTLTKIIKDCLVRFTLPLGQCRGQAYDGASNMSGHIRGVAADIQREEPSAIYVHCLAHCTNLCLQTVGKEVSPIRDALDLVMELSKLIRFSPKRSTLFQTMQAQVSPGSPSLKPLCPTRWTVRTAAIQSVITNYSLLCDVLEQVNREGRDEYAMKAGGFLNQMEKFSTLFGLKLSHLIFSATEQLSLSLQGKDTTIQEAVQASKLAINYLERQRSEEVFERFYRGVIEASNGLTSPPALPRYRRRPRRIDDGEPTHSFESPQSYFRQQYFEAVDLVHEELKRRFQQTRGMPIAAFDRDDSREKLQLYAKDIDIPRC